MDIGLVVENITAQVQWMKGGKKVRQLGMAIIWGPFQSQCNGRGFPHTLPHTPLPWMPAPPALLIMPP